MTVPAAAMAANTVSSHVKPMLKQIAESSFGVTIAEHVPKRAERAGKLANRAFSRFSDKSNKVVNTVRRTVSASSSVESEDFDAIDSHEVTHM